MDDATCPLCTEDLDPTDLLFASRLCQCRFAVCLWCFRRLTEDAAKENRPALCPNCREPYDTERIAREGNELDPEQVEEVKRKKGKQDGRKGSASARPRKDLTNVRVVQRNLVYIVGLPMECCFEDVLMSQEYIGQFGKIVKISVSRSGPYGSTQAKNGPTGSAYVTFKRDDDARRCIESIHSTLWEGKLVKACYGTTKYCNAFLKGLACNNVDCLYLHDVAVEEDSYTKEETKTSKFVNLVHAASLNQPGSLVQPNSTSVTDLSSAYSGFDQGGDTSMDEELNDAQGWPSLSNSNVWSKQNSTLLSSQQSIPLADDIQAWPGLPGGTESGNVTTNPSSADTSENEADSSHIRGTSSQQGTTMAVKLARVSSTRDSGKEKEQPKKLTPLPARHKSHTSTDSNLHRDSDQREVSRLSPPPTPQLVPDKAPQKLLSPELEEAMSTVMEEPDGQQETQEKDESASGNIEEAVPRPPPGFSNPYTGSKTVAPPPGFSSLPSHSSFPSQNASVIPSAPSFALQASANQIWETQPSLALNSGYFSSSTRLNFASEGRNSSLGSTSQRSQSRFTFAQGNDDAAETSSQSSESRLPDLFLSGQSSYAQFNPGHSIFGGVFGPNGSSLYSTLPSPMSATSQPNKGEDLEGESLPAGLMLLKRLQAQGGISRPKSETTESKTQFQHSIFSDPAIMSATPQHAGSEPSRDSQPAPKTPPRRRKSKNA